MVWLFIGNSFQNYLISKFSKNRYSPEDGPKSRKIGSVAHYLISSIKANPIMFPWWMS